MKKTIATLLSAVVALGCAGALVACGDNTKPDNKPDNKPQEQIEYSVYGRFTYENDGKDKDDAGATYECWVDTGNKFHIYGTLAHDDGTKSILEFEGQVVNITQYTLKCEQIMFFKYEYHGVEYPTGGPGNPVTKAYKDAWEDEHGNREFEIYLVRKNNEVSGATREDCGISGTFSVQEGWDVAEGVWEYDPTAAAE